MATNVTTRLLQYVGGKEGWVSTYYLDPVHIPTIGYGFTWNSNVFRDWWTKSRGRKFKRGDTMTQAEGYEVLKLILVNEVEPPVLKRLGKQALNVLEAAMSGVFNFGAGGLKWKWAQAIVNGNIREAARLYRQTATTAKGKKLPGLVIRRNEEADIMEHNRWPAWVEGTDMKPPETHMSTVDIKQGQLWLNELGFPCGETDGLVGPRTKQATLAFQRSHGQLKEDGIMGRATMAALQRAVDLKKKALTTVGAGTPAVAGTGVADANTTIDVGGFDIGPWLFWGSLIVTVAVLGYLAWRYRDEITVAIRKL